MIDKTSILVFPGSTLLDANSIVRSLDLFIGKMTGGTILLVAPFDLRINTLTEMVEKHQNQLDTSSLLEGFRKAYFQLAAEVLDNDEGFLAEINDDLIEMEWTLEDPPEDDAAFVKDQLVTVAAVVSSKIVAAYFNKKNVACSWVDARDLFVADNNYGAGDLLIAESQKRCQTLLKNLIEGSAPVVTPAGIACTTENFNVTLGLNGNEKIINFLTAI